MTAPNPPPPPACWNFFDMIYCISLDSNPDRQPEARRQFAANGLARLDTHMPDWHRAVRKLLMDGNGRPI